jgi:hypothetical protein
MYYLTATLEAWTDVPFPLVFRMDGEYTRRGGVGAWTRWKWGHESGAFPIECIYSQPSVVDLDNREELAWLSLVPRFELPQNVR